MRTVRILAVGNMYPPHHAGGYELAWQAVVRHAQRLGHAVRILTSDYRDRTVQLEDDPGVRRTLRMYWDQDGYRFVHTGRRQRVALERHNAAELSRNVREFRPDIVAWFSMGCLSLSLIEQARRIGLPAVFVVHDDWLVYGWELDAWMHMWRGNRQGVGRLAELLVGIPTSVNIDAAGPLVFNSRYTCERARRRGYGLTGSSVVPPGISERFLEPADPEPWRWRLAYMGRLDRQKGVDIAVRALAYLPATATLTIWGSGDNAYAAELEALADEIGARARVRFAGFGDEESLRAGYAGADVVVFPVRWEEPFGLVPLEAMGVGRPLVTTARGGTAEFVRDGDNALVFPVDDPVVLAECVRRLAGDEALRARLRDGGRRTAAEYPESRFAERTVRAIVEAAAGSGNGQGPVS